MNKLEDDPIFGSIKAAIDSAHESDMRILGLLDLAADRLNAHAAEIMELREGLAALSNRLEAVTQAVAAAGVAGLHSVKA